MKIHKNTSQFQRVDQVTALVNPNDIRVLCQAVDKPVNVVMGLSGVQATVRELQAAGLKRISVGGSFARAAMGEFIRTAQEVKNDGTFFYADRAISDPVARAYMSGEKRPGNAQKNPPGNQERLFVGFERRG